MMRRRDFITLLGGAAVWPVAARAQDRPAIPMIGYLSSSQSESVLKNMEGFRQGLIDAGYVEGRNLIIDYRWAEGHSDRLPSLALELVHRQVAAIATNGIAAMVAKAATSTIPIVFETGSDPVESGLVASLNRPGGNLTGIFFLSRALEPKRLALLREMVPAATSIAFLVNPIFPRGETEMRDMDIAARMLGVRLRHLTAGSPGEIEAAFAILSRERADAVLVSSDPLYFDQRLQLAALASRYAIPAMHHDRQLVDAGGLMSYGAHIPDGYRLVGTYVGRILNGEKPADLPVQQSTKIELVINLKTAKALGLAVPPTLLARADEVIE
jgi:putative ABC transport system substrate-binding protein